MSKITERNNAILKAREIFSNKDKYIIIDTETSGIGNCAEVVEICAISLEGKVLIESFFNPKGIISPEAIDIHGLTREILQQKGAVTWDACASEISQLFADKIIIAYNASFDKKMIGQTAALYGFDSPIEETFCIMRLRQLYSGSQNTEKLNGDHTAKGDCLRTLDLLNEIAHAELTEDPESFDIENDDDLINLCLKLQEISAQRLALEKQEEAIQAKCGFYLKDMDKEDVSLGNGQKVVRKYSMVKLKSQVPLEELPEYCTVTRLDTSSVKKLLQQGKIDNNLFSYEDKWSIGFKKQ